MVEAKEVQLRLTHFYKSEKRGMYTSIGLGYARSKEMELFSPLKDPPVFKNHLTYSFEIGYSVLEGIKCGLDIGNIPGIINLSFSIKLL